MSDPTVQVLQTEQTMNYLITAAGALVAYNQVLTFSQEASISDNHSPPQFLIILVKGQFCMESKMELYDGLVPHRPLHWIAICNRKHSLQHAYQLDLLRVSDDIDSDMFHTSDRNMGHQQFCEHVPGFKLGRQHFYSNYARHTCDSYLRPIQPI
ncbi:hypothetical protein BJ138DRAFT_523624 [Hygrophoropsis aurantiaca]|uniref:Uncharacterized protein n=1 Tax=Hygrophoropsis aurantiaca TaxID=72124 RepID=A0ACB8A249_9AGAM|nr:hypothetical protein BJ138DRAFT_523624 [Hygrophoropsis aurantiaca]